MNRGKKIAILIWVIAGVLWLAGLVSILSSTPAQLPPSVPLAAAPILIVPFLFFLVVIGVLIPRPPPAPVGSLLADLERHFNVHVFFGVAVIMFGVLQLFQAYRADQLLDGYFFYCFFFSGGLGVLAGGLIHARRRSPDAGATPTDQRDSGVLASIRRLRATNLSAFLTGIWTVLSTSAAIALISPLDLLEETRGSLILVTAAVLFFGPAAIFVWGVQNDASGGGISVRLKRFGTRELRALCWLLGTVAAGYAIRALGIMP